MKSAGKYGVPAAPWQEAGLAAGAGGPIISGFRTSIAQLVKQLMCSQAPVSVFEEFFSHFVSIKSEPLPAEGIFEYNSEACSAIFDYLECFHNRRRLHSALGYQSPQNFLTRYFQNQKHQLK